MIYTEEEQFYTDFDWYAIDKRDCVVHFASEGGKLPKAIASSSESNELINDYIQSLPNITEVLFNPNLRQIASLSNQVQYDRYVESFAAIAAKGCYSFSKSVNNNFYDVNSHLVAYPVNPLKLEDLPIHIQEVLSKTKMEVTVSDVLEINIAEYLEY